MIGGVCAGIAEYFGVDVVVVRLIWLLLALMGGPGVLGYIIAWIVIPPEPAIKESAESQQEQPEGQAEARLEAGAEVAQHQSTRTGEVVIAVLLICVGGIFLLRQFMPHHWLMWLSWARWWPLLIIGAGVALLLRSSAK